MGNGGCSAPARGLAVGQSPTSLHVGEAIDKVSLAGKTAEARKRIIDSSSQRVMVRVCGWFVWRGKLSSEKIGSFGFRGSWGVGGKEPEPAGSSRTALHYSRITDHQGGLLQERVVPEIRLSCVCRWGKFNVFIRKGAERLKTDDALLRYGCLRLCLTSWRILKCRRTKRESGRRLPRLSSSEASAFLPCLAVEPQWRYPCVSQSPRRKSTQHEHKNWDCHTKVSQQQHDPFLQRQGSKLRANEGEMICHTPAPYSWGLLVSQRE